MTTKGMKIKNISRSTRSIVGWFSTFYSLTDFDAMLQVFREKKQIFIWRYKLLSYLKMLVFSLIRQYFQRISVAVNHLTETKLA